MTTKSTPSFAPVYSVFNGYLIDEASVNFCSDPGSCTQGFNGIVADNCFVYTTDGVTIQKRDNNTGALLASASIPGGVSAGGLAWWVPDGNAGIAVDSCGNIYAGSRNAVYKFSNSLALITSAPTSGAVFAVDVNINGEVLACGEGFVASIATLNPCQPITCTSKLPLLVSPATICAGSTVILTASGASSYSWSTGQTTSSVVVSPSATTSYTVTGTGFCGSGTAIGTVTVVNNLIATAGPNSTICAGQNVTLTATGGSPYSWNTGATTSSIIVSPASTTNYSVTVGSSSCSGTATATVTVVSNITATAGPSATICSGQAVTFNASGGNNYSWSSGQTTSSITVAATATTTYSVIVSSGNCSDTVSAAVTVNPSPSVFVTGNTTLCAGDIATLTASGSTNYSWNNGNTASIINVSPGTTTTYTVTTSNASCTSTTSVTVVVAPPPVANAIGALICLGQTTTLTASGGGNYSWSNGSTGNLILVSPTSTSTYSVIVSIGSCWDTASATVTVNPSPTVTAWSNVTIQQGQSTTLAASGGGVYLWSNGSTDNPITVSPLVTTFYCVTVTQNNCSDTACVTVYVEPIDCSYADDQLFVPDAFSPNGDTKNDRLGIYFPNISCIKELVFIIYDRWGEKVFFATGGPASGGEAMNSLWDGTYKGKLMNTAVFVYYMKVTFITGNETVRKGNVSLIR
ncbi:MAG: gliding motility-associated C-terminal domain-containing protein [Bacteroidetes bacterium]|nr:MAG: gliding motility-associated C-terminal domain-containing protein [Bacteroidota bacterium]